MRANFPVRILFAQLLLVFSFDAGLAAPCVAPPATDQAISQFKSDPKAIVAPGSDARAIESSVADLAGTDASLAVELIRLAEGTTRAFRMAIAAGLAKAAVACSTVDQNAALLIQQAVASLNDGEFQNAFAAVAGDLSTAATSAALSSAASSVGSVVITNPNVSPGSPKNPGGGGSPAIFQINSGGLAVAPNGSPTVSGSSTAANPVSATR